MNWTRILAYITGTVDQELLLRNEYLAAENRIDVLIHAAGYESSHRLDRKSVQEFNQTLAIKATGFFHLYKALEEQARPSLVEGAGAGRRVG